jgi:catechol 2,3-dioxygenase-like lactoylglutathione lyase family enzyme
MVTSFRHVCIIVKDLDRAIVFYRDVLGLKLEKVREIAGPRAEEILGKKGAHLLYAKMRTADQSKDAEPVLELHCWKYPRKKAGMGGGHLAFTFGNIERAYRAMKRRGVRFVSAPSLSPSGRTKLCFGYDPDGNLIEFFQDLPSRKG